MAKLNSGVPKGEIQDKWTQYKDSINLVNPANKRNIDVIVVGTGLAGGSASATLAELGYNVKTFTSSKFLGTQILPSFLSDSDIRVNFD